MYVVFLRILPDLTRFSCSSTFFTSFSLPLSLTPLDRPCLLCSFIVPEPLPASVLRHLVAPTSTPSFTKV